MQQMIHYLHISQKQHVSIKLFQSSQYKLRHGGQGTSTISQINNAETTEKTLFKPKVDW